METDDRKRRARRASRPSSVASRPVARKGPSEVALAARRVLGLDSVAPNGASPDVTDAGPITKPGAISTSGGSSSNVDCSES
jgi:hypothetical protein